MKLKLPDTVSSAQDLATLAREIGDYKRWFEHEAIKKRVNAKHKSEEPVLSTSVSDILHSLDTKEGIDQKSLDELTEMLVQYGKNAPTMTVTLAAPPTGSTKKTLISWSRENIAPNILVNFKFNSTLLGGMVINLGSRTFDWSFRRQILASSSNFPEVLKRV